ncbi:unnamed protein product, partial [Cylicostephanus goldi]
MCMSAVQANGTLRHYDVKNLYGWSESKITQLGQYKAKIVGLGKDLFRYIGSDICGFNRESEEELCLRWHQMGAFHTFMRNHNSHYLPPQDPAQWPSVAKATRKATLFRYSYLPYLFSLYFEYGQLLESGDHTFPAPWESLIPVFVRGGSILPRQQPNITTDYTRKNAFELLVAPSSKDGHASGFLYWDDGESIVESFKTHPYYQWSFTYSSSEKSGSLTVTKKRDASSLKIPTLDTIEVLGCRGHPDFNSFELNGRKIQFTTRGVPAPKNVVKFRKIGKGKKKGR